VDYLVMVIIIVINVITINTLNVGNAMAKEDILLVIGIYLAMYVIVLGK
jgi:hypothetical protein